MHECMYACMVQDMGMEVETRPIDFDQEISTMREVGASGTAVVLAPGAKLHMHILYMCTFGTA